MMYSFSEDRIDDCNGEVVWSNFEQRANESPCSDIIHMAAFAPPHFRADVLNENTSSIPINAFLTYHRNSFPRTGDVQINRLSASRQIIIAGSQ
jgi:hypothetical protein